MEVNKGFFALPVEEKELYAMKSSSGVGYGRRFDVKDGAKADWVDRLGFWSAPDELKKAEPLDVKRPKEFKYVQNIGLFASPLSQPRTLLNESDKGFGTVVLALRRKIGRSPRGTDNMGSKIIVLGTTCYYCFVLLGR